MKSSRLSALAIAGAAGLSCATVGEPAPAGPPPFAAVRRIALVRVRPDPAAARPKDPLDALGESLAARGYEARQVEIGRGAGPELRALERLHARTEGWVVSAPPRGRFGRRADALGADAGEAVRGLGVDAVALYHRFDERPFSAFPEPPLGASAFPRRREPARPVAALTVVDRDGNAVGFEWGAAGAELDPSAPVNAAEAIDLLLRALAGDPEDGQEG